MPLSRRPLPRMASTILVTGLTLAACVPGTPSTMPAAPGAAPGGALGGVPAAADTYVPKEGETIVDEFAVDDVVSARTTYRFYELEEAAAVAKAADGSSPTLIALVEKTEVPNALSAGSPAATLTPETLRTFLRDQWDAYQNGKDDPGTNAREFLTMLDETGLDAASFLAEYQASGLTLGQFVDLLRGLTSFKDAHGSLAPDLFFDLLKEGQMTAAGFQQLLQGRGLTAAAFAGNLKGAGLDLNGLRTQWRQTDTTLPAFLGAQPYFQAKGLRIADAATGLEIAKFGWTVLKDNKPVTKTDGASTFVLNHKDKDPLNYGYAKNFASKTYSWNGKNVFNKTLYSAKWQVKGTHDARNPAFGGQYLPSVYVDFTDTYAIWSWHLNGSAAISAVSNLAAPTAPNPQIDVVTKLESSGLLQHFSKSFTTRITGAKGVTQQ